MDGWPGCFWSSFGGVGDGRGVLQNEIVISLLGTKVKSSGYNPKILCKGSFLYLLLRGPSSFWLHHLWPALSRKRIALLCQLLGPLKILIVFIPRTWTTVNYVEARRLFDPIIISCPCFSGSSYRILPHSMEHVYEWLSNDMSIIPRHLSLQDPQWKSYCLIPWLLGLWQNTVE